MQRVLDLLQGSIEKQRVVVRTEFAEPAPLVTGDPVQLQQVAVNLVTNALEAMVGTGRQRRLTIRTEIRRGEGPEAMVVTVEDSGGGLDPDQVDRIFDSFYTTKKDGIGVGLAISRSIIEAHGGSVWAAPGRRFGARVGFALPLAAVPVEPSVKTT